jgi:hypothetical protein
VGCEEQVGAKFSSQSDRGRWHYINWPFKPKRAVRKRAARGSAWEKASLLILPAISVARQPKLWRFQSEGWWAAGDSNSGPALIKSQGQSGPEANINKKAQLFLRPAYFFFANGRCMFCPGSGTKQAQPGRGLQSPLPCQAAFADISIRKSCSVLPVRRHEHRLLSARNGH